MSGGINEKDIWYLRGFSSAADLIAVWNVFRPLVQVGETHLLSLLRFVIETTTHAARNDDRTEFLRGRRDGILAAVGL